MAVPKILLCDDEFHILRAAEIKLRRAGYEVICANDGAEALEIIAKHKPDMLVTDYQMPRLDGIELCQRLRASPDSANLPIIMLTAKRYEISTDEVVQRLRISEVIAKPFSPRYLVEKCCEVLGVADPSPKVSVHAPTTESSS